MIELTPQYLGSVISISKGRKHEITDSPSSTSRRLIGIDDLRNDDLVRYTDDASGTEAVPDDVLIAWDGANAGTIGYGKGGYIGSTIARLRVNPGVRLFTPFLGFYLKSKFDYLRQTATGATIPHISRSALKDISLPAVEYDDQIRIAHLLGKVEGLIAQRKQHLQQLDDLLKSVFLEMFGDPMRNERGWDKPELKAFGTISTGNTPPRNEPANYDDDFIEWIKTDNITGDAVLVTQATEHLSESGAKKARTVTNGALLVACIAGSVESIGRAALTDRAVSFNQQINAIQPSKDVNALYLYGLFKLSRAYIQSHATKGMKKILTKGDFSKITMIKPPVEIQNQFAVIVEQVEGIKSRYQQSLTDLEALYGALSQQAFKGELDLSRVALATTPIEGEKPVAAAVPAPITTPVIELPETDLLLPVLQDRAQLAPLLRFWLEAYRMQLGRAVFSLERFIAAAQTRLAELHPDNDFELAASDYEPIKAWVFEALAAGALTQGFDDDGNRIELKAASEQSLA
ncbi:restriction endonuclease subunit S [Acidovorax cavernicola]|uniref:Restriction endonuclease subunit S n=1 Tax=Acidovorax cavernicola TaxID=1675792 RepID=A0A9X8D624_9BURK|nr:restriction endonuclease subunit S [Acidovorax cavernicola]RIX81271.1 restriction endonuclease subunit S [Acidovorax cavernicola]